MKQRTNNNVTSIHRQLLLTLFLPATAVLVAGTVSDYLTAVAPLTEAYDQALLDRRVADVRRELGLDAAPGPARALDVVLFALASLAGLAIGLVFLALLVPVAVIANVAALFRRR